ncbi:MULTISPECIES: hypothetical protein [unclassified Microbacterium]|uniref:hypothetical protein n=1 Tax=unclassified Microbacterium TaxID=2609290 RepID=UPI000EAA3F40|nr:MULTISPECIES: hypothetical protein [unclassified Microbacterium]MBT2483978.1 hypothetical protein [Microbacterium sp. ISL-108]RKN66943.1 hypothetical protein D7252_04620 [Microbacterium sp. CGR2]
MRVIVSVIGALACDVIIAFGGARLLWESGVTSVADAPTMSYVIVVLASAFLVIVRYAVLGLSRGRPAVIECVLVGDVVLTAAVALLWQIQNAYFLGWVVSYCSALLLVMGIFELFGVAAGRARTTVRNVVVADFIRFFVILSAGAGFVVTSTIHQWNLPILNVSLLTAAVGVGIGVVGRAVLFRSQSETPERVVDGTKAEVAPDAVATVDGDPAPGEAGPLEPQTAETRTSPRRSGGSRTIDASNV